MDFNRELVKIEQHLLTEDPHLAEQLDTFDKISGHRPASSRPRRLLALLVVIGLLLAIATALAAGAATDHREPPKAQQRHSEHTTRSAGHGRRPAPG